MKEKNLIEKCENMVDAGEPDQYVIVLGNVCRIIEGYSKTDALRRYMRQFEFGFNIGNVFEGRIESLRNLKTFRMQADDAVSGDAGALSCR